MSWKPLLAAHLAVENDKVDQAPVPVLLQLIFRDVAKPEVSYLAFVFLLSASA